MSAVMVRSRPVLTTFKVSEVDAQTMTPTGRVEHFMANSPAQAVQSVLYTKRLADGNAFVGPSGYVVYSMGKVYPVVPSSGR